MRRDWPFLAALCLSGGMVGYGLAEDAAVLGPCGGNGTCAFTCIPNPIANNEWLASSDMTAIKTCQQVSSPLCNPKASKTTCSYVVYNNQNCASVFNGQPGIIRSAQKDYDDCRAPQPPPGGG